MAVRSVRTKGETFDQAWCRPRFGGGAGISRRDHAGAAGLASAAEGAPAVSTPVAWVANQSVRSATKGSVTTIDTATNMVIKNIPLSCNALAVALTPDGKTAYVLNLAQGASGKGTVTPIDTATNTAGKPIKAGTFPDALHLLVITPNGKTLYAVGNTAMTPIDTATNAARPAIRVAPRHSQDLTTAIAPDGSTVYVGGSLGPGSTKGFVVPVSTAIGTVGKAIVFRGLPSVMALTPDGKMLYVVCDGSVDNPQDVVPINTTTSTAGRPINTGLQPVAIAITGSHQQR